MTSDGLTSNDRIKMQKLFNFNNFTSFVKLSDISDMIQIKTSGAGVAIPCLWSEMLQKNIYLIPGENIYICLKVIYSFFFLFN